MTQLLWWWPDIVNCVIDIDNDPIIIIDSSSYWYCYCVVIDGQLLLIGFIYWTVLLDNYCIGIGSIDNDPNCC